MKQGTLIVRVIVLVFFLGILAYFGVYVWTSLTSDTATAALYTYTAEERVEASGYFFRDETVLTGAADLAEVLAAEGEKVGAGDPVARIYSSAGGYQIQQQLDEARSTLENLQYILSRTNESADTMALDDNIVAAFTGIRSSVASGDLTGLDSAASELRTLVFRRDYTYNGSDSLTAQIDETQALVDSLSAQASAAYDTVLAPASGLYSSCVDGYEGIFTVEALEGLTPSGLTALAGEGRTAPEGGLGKVITSQGWYFACGVPVEETKNLYDGASVVLRFADASREFSARVTRVSDEENGMAVVVFFSQDYGPQVTALRAQSVDIITGRATGFRVPKRAVRVADDGTLGLYRVSGAQAGWVEVNILWEEDDYYLVAQAPKLDENGEEAELSSFEKASRLRDGDAVVVKGEEIYDGKVLAD